jgi:hypothetical protein
MKKLISLLIAAIMPILIGLLYAIFEDDILRLLASLPQNTNQKIIVRAAFLSVSLVILGLSYFILEFRSKYVAEKKKSENFSLSLGDLSAPNRLLKKRKDDPSPDVPATKGVFHNNLLWLSDVLSKFYA